jgi:hypothetical protein
LAGEDVCRVNINIRRRTQVFRLTGEGRWLV